LGRGGRRIAGRIVDELASLGLGGTGLGWLELVSQAVSFIPISGSKPVRERTVGFWSLVGAQAITPSAS
jgi:hypothetical protein